MNQNRQKCLNLVSDQRCEMFVVHVITQDRWNTVATLSTWSGSGNQVRVCVSQSVYLCE